MTTTSTRPGQDASIPPEEQPAGSGHDTPQASPGAPPAVDLPLSLAEAIRETELVLRAKRVEVQQAAALERLRRGLHEDRRATQERGHMWDVADVLAVIKRELFA